MKTKTLKHNRGFTIIETLVALAIFASSVVALITVTANGSANVNYSKNKFIASYLAQEGLELVHNQRDTYSLNDPGLGWQDFLGPDGLQPCLLSGNASGCIMDATSVPYTNSYPCSGVCPPLSYDSATGRYFDQVQPANPSIFTRTIKIDNTLENGDEVVVTSTVSWSQGLTTQSVSYSEELFNWLQQ